MGIFLFYQEVDVEIGGQRIDKHYSTWLQAWRELSTQNYNPDATDDDGSCTYAPLGELTFGTIDYDAGTLEINLDCEYDVSSFIFDLTGVNPTGYYGGTSEAAGFDISMGFCNFLST